MKNLFTLLVLVLITSSDLLAQKFQKYERPSSRITCNWKSTIANTGLVCDYEDLSVRVDPQARKMILFMELFINNKSVKKDTQWPFIFTNDSKTNYLRPGYHKLKVKIVDRCHKTNYIYKTIYITKCPR